MIGKLSGSVSVIDEKGIIVETSGVGFRLHVLGEYLQSVSVGSSVSLWTHLAVREDALELFGFEKKDELDFFSLLIAVSGIGPKSALSILTIAPPDTLRRAISARDISYLTRVSGIGKKTAEKIILELKDKLAHDEDGDAMHDLKEDADVILALRSLGYGAKEARDAVKHVPKETEETGGRIKEALKYLSS